MSSVIIAGVSVAAAAAGAVFSHGLFSPRGQLFGKVIYRGAQGRDAAQAGNRIALTFDDGPHPTATDRIRETLDRHQIRAVFFVVGANVLRWPDVVRRLHESGHEIGNHTFDHSYAGMFRGRRYWLDQLRRTNDAITQITGKPPVWFRPPMGFKHPGVIAAAGACGQQVVTWSRRGFDGVRTTSTRIHDRLATHARAGEILLLHDGAPPQIRRDPQATVDAVEPLIQSFKSRSLEMLTLGELVQ